MKRLNPQEESLIPRISPIHFTLAKSARKLDLEPHQVCAILEFHSGWNLIGWALANDVMPRDLCPYVILCESNGFQVWCHISHLNLKLIIEKVQADTSRITSLR
jgi:hypothetical protein